MEKRLLFGGFLIVMAIAVNAQVQIAEVYDSSAKGNEIITRISPWKEKSGMGTNIGIMMTDMGGLPTVNLNVRIPIWKYFAVNIKPFLVPSITPGDSGLSFGGRAEIEAHTPVMLNLLRVHIAGGPQFFYGLSGISKHEFDWSGGWVIGLEVFCYAWVSANFEVGTSGGTVGNSGNGTTIATGVTFYPFKYCKVNHRK